MRQLLALILMATLLLGISGCGRSAEGSQTGVQGKLVLTGSSTVAPLAAEIGKRFEALHPNVRIDVQTGGSTRGVIDAREGTADIGMASRALKTQEHDLHAFTIAQDGICVIIHASNTITNLSDRQISDIYTGKINNWSEVGGHDAPITVVNKAEGRSTLELFLKHFKMENTNVQPDVVIGDNQQGIKVVSGNPNAIGYVSVGAAEYETRHHTPIKLLPIGGVDASVANVGNGTFPLSRPLNLLTKDIPADGSLERQFIEFAQSDQVHDLIKELYFVPITHD